ncbi:PREDICTED: UDP-glucuronosyltransferase-like [Rhagoletis zephyria]|uniref:UDP-glucuronosyltransferase-like n=1 Tax=Rhagoletis zephyria TaxID=28612 RepID=UPI000811471F|nr:PREDICTED: UDP-glucuronosyltransferase-like [Rhagoletis zephyria]
MQISGNNNSNKAMLLIYFLLATLAGQIPTICSRRILGIFPHFGYSHFKVFYPLLRTLAEHGHHITVVTHIKASSDTKPPNYEELLLGGHPTGNFVTFNQVLPRRPLHYLLLEAELLHSEGQKSCKKFYESGHVETILKLHEQQPFDLVITEFFNTDCQLGIPYLLQVPVVGLSSCLLMPYYYDRIALPDFPSYVQSEFVGFPEELSWHQRLLNFVQMKFIKNLYRYRTNYYDRQLIKKYLNVDFDVDEFAKRSTSLILVNQHYTFNGNKPLTPQLIEMGGIHIEEKATTATLPAEIEKFLKNAPHDGVLFVSWGSMVRASSMPSEKAQAIVKALEQQPFNVIWKWESDELPTKSKKFLFVKWAPQLSLLCHPKVKIFWGHAGLLGTTENVYCGKPIITTPLYGDQSVNAYAIQNRGAGTILLYDDINEKNLLATLKEIRRKSYAEHAAALSHIFRNRDMKPLDKAVWWVEHLLQEQGKTAHKLLQTKATKLNWFVYYSLDSVCILLGIVAAVIFIARVVLRRLLAIFKQSKPKNAKVKTK